MTAQQTALQSLSESPANVVDFIINNNPAGVQSNLDTLGLLPSDLPNPTRAQLKEAVMDLVTIGGQKAEDTFKFVLAVDYDSENTDGTGNLRDELESGIYGVMPGMEGEQSDSRGSVWVVLIDGVFEVANSVFGWLSLQEQSDITANIADASQYDYQRNTLFGIPKEIVLALIAVIGIIALVALLKPKK